MFLLPEGFISPSYCRQRANWPICPLDAARGSWALDQVRTNLGRYAAKSISIGAGVDPGGMWRPFGDSPYGLRQPDARHSEADLWTIWKAAQDTLSQEVDLNPLQRSFSGAPADIRPGDPRAQKIWPHQLRVGAEPDVASSALLAATGARMMLPGVARLGLVHSRSLLEN